MSEEQPRWSVALAEAAQGLRRRSAPERRRGRAADRRERRRRPATPARTPTPFVRRPPRPRQRKGRSVGSDSILILGLLVVGLVALRFLLPASGPLSVSATSSPDGSAVAIGSAAGGTVAPRQSGAVVTLGPVVNPSLDLDRDTHARSNGGPDHATQPHADPQAGPDAAPDAHPTGTPTPTVRPSTPRAQRRQNGRRSTSS